jgi:2-polyprenyl-3-methyl-5-hydroxy-6-metoxy-1,4-benzoquinol methylase
MPNIYEFKDFEGSSHHILIALVRRHLQQPGGRLLDLGAAGGELAASLAGHFDARMGFEYNLDSIGDLRRNVDAAVIADIETVPRLPRGMRAVVLADVIEHLTRPRLILDAAREALDDSGLLFLSVPNVANLTVRLELLAGSFTYRRRGILDSTHLRFYTKRSVVEEIEQAGFEVIDLRASSVPIRLVLGGKFPDAVISAGEKILLPLTRAWKTLLGYQIIVVARKRT